MNFIANESAKKLRGGYYTPEDLATFLCKWVLEKKPTKVLEPSCGDGIFFKALGNAGVDKNLSVIAIEFDELEASKAKSRAQQAGLKSSKIHVADFLSWSLDMTGQNEASFDAVIGNPPFIRYQYLPTLFQEKAEQVFHELKLPFTKHTNAWVPFILASMRMLKPGGRLAMVVPAEIIHVMHAQSLRTYLGNECSKIVIIDPEELWFDGTLQGAVLLMAEKRKAQSDHADGLAIYEVKNREFLRKEPAYIFSCAQPINGKSIQGKWTSALLDKETRELFEELREHQEIYKFSDVADVDVGIVTGANKFFLVTDDVVAKNGLERWAHPMFGRSEHCPGIIYDAKQHASNAAAGKPTNFLWFPDNEPMRYKKPRAYIESGEAESLHTRYKCRIRQRWFSVPSVYSAEIGMLKRSNNYPRLILNKLGAFTTDTAYRIKCKNGVSPEKLVGCFFNSLTALSAELEGRHYGGGVLELVPSEIEKLIVPVPKNIRINLKALDKKIRTQNSDSVLEESSKPIFDEIGLSRAKQERVINGWKSLRNRRQRISSEE
ncbi:MAG: methyltransferase domain-containing protein [Cellvibrionales bacterium]|nr:MAG: methyltransferase domain-containing protein [Cellvibrionales bacterium]